MFTKAKKQDLSLRMAITGPSGSGKTLSSLALASGMGSRVALIDTEHGSASIYADQFEFDVVQLTSFEPERYIEGIEAAVLNRYDVLVIDSLSHAWVGTGGLLKAVDKASGKNDFAKWGQITPRHNALIQAILSAPIHIIATMRSKMAYALELNDRGKQVPVKVGLEPVQRAGNGIRVRHCRGHGCEPHDDN